MSVAIQFKDTWWNSLRVERNIAYKKLVQYMDCCISRVGGWFSGQKLPDRADIIKICDLFDVDYLEGERHFIEDNEKWQSEHKRTHLASTGVGETKNPRKKRTKIKVAQTQVKDVSEEIPNILELAYGAIDYTDYIKVSNVLSENPTDILNSLYGKVSYEAFKAIEFILRGENK